MFAGALEGYFFWRKEDANHDERQFIVNFNQSALSPVLKFAKETKKGREDVLCSLHLYGRFLTAMTITTVAIATAAMIATAAPATYIITGSC